MAQTASSGRIVASAVSRGPTRGKDAAPGPTSSCHARCGSPTAPSKHQDVRSSGIRTVRVRHPVEGLGVLRARRQPHAM